MEIVETILWPEHLDFNETKSWLRIEFTANSKARLLDIKEWLNLTCHRNWDWRIDVIPNEIGHPLATVRLTFLIKDPNVAAFLKLTYL